MEPGAALRPVMYETGDGVAVRLGYGVELVGPMMHARKTESWQGGKSRQTRPNRDEATLLDLHS